MSFTLRELAPADLSVRPLLEGALALRAGPGADVQPWVEHLESELQEARLEGFVALRGPGVAGVAVWARGGALGANVHVLTLAAPYAVAENYGWLLDAVRARRERVAFAPGPLSGLTVAEEEQVMVARGFARYGRSEMKLPADHPLPAPREAGPGTVRPIVPGDEPRLVNLHRRAYATRFDRYLFLEDLDEQKDAAREVHQLLEGRWGPLAPTGSVVLEAEGQLVGAVLAVRRPDGYLIADVAVDPTFQGRGFGRRVLEASVRGLRAAGDGAIALNVTEGNRPALELYARLGFVRTMGPSQDWYHTAVIPYPP